MITLRQERAADIPVREALLDQAFGTARRKKSSERLREGRRPAEGLGFVATDGNRVVGTARLWPVACASGQSALLLGPVAVAADRPRPGHRRCARASRPPRGASARPQRGHPGW